MLKRQGQTRALSLPLTAALESGSVPREGPQCTPESPQTRAASPQSERGSAARMSGPRVPDRPPELHTICKDSSLPCRPFIISRAALLSHVIINYPLVHFQAGCEMLTGAKLNHHPPYEYSWVSGLPETCFATWNLRIRLSAVLPQKCLVVDRFER